MVAHLGRSHLGFRWDRLVSGPVVVRFGGQCSAFSSRTVGTVEVSTHKPSSLARRRPLKMAPTRAGCCIWLLYRTSHVSSNSVKAVLTPYAWHMHKDAFNADFFVAAATVIPVLFLALTLQGNTYEEILTYWQKKVKETAENNRKLANIINWLIYTTAGFVLACGFIGEVYAMISLYYERSSSDRKQFVIFSVVLLLAVTVFGPAIRFSKTTWLNIRALADYTPKESVNSANEKPSNGSQTGPSEAGT
jgi:hypothetical protein